MRLEKDVARRRRCTRKQARKWIRQGRVAVEGMPIRDPATRVAEGARITFDGQALNLPPRGAAFHKPPGVQCTVGDPLGRRSLAEEAADLLALGLHPVGRLDADSEGLLLFLSDGAHTQRLLHPRHGVEKRYEATVAGAIPEDLDEQLSGGVATALGTFSARLVEVVATEHGGRITLVVTEGKHRMVRRMLANLGLPVQRLLRRAFGPVWLGDLPPGAWRALTEAELAAVEAGPAS